MFIFKNPIENTFWVTSNFIQVEGPLIYYVRVVSGFSDPPTHPYVFT